MFEVTNNKLNIMRIKPGSNITATPNNYGVLTVDLAQRTEADLANMVTGQIYVDTQNGHVLKMKS